MQEEESKGKELAAAAVESAKFQKKKAKADKEAAEKKAVADKEAATKKAKADKDSADKAAVALKKKVDEENKKFMMPDGNIHKDGKKYFADGTGVVEGVNNFSSRV